MKSQQAVLAFTDLVDSVRLQQHVGAAVYGRLKARHDAAMKAAVGSCAGAEIIESTGDGFYLRFPTCSAAVEACLRFQHALTVDNTEDFKLKARVGIHAGEVFIEEGVTNRLLGMAPNITARVMSLALPGQILLTEPVYHDAHQYVRQHPRVENQSEQPVLRWLNHGEYMMKGADFPIGIFEVGAVGVAPLQTPPSSEKARRMQGDLATVGGEDPYLPGNEIVRQLMWIGKVAAVVVAAVCAWMAWSSYAGKADKRRSQAPSAIVPSDSAGRANAATSAVKPAEPPATEFRIKLTRLVCIKTNDLDGEDQVTLDLTADGKHVAVKYPDNFEGKPCFNLKAGEEWKLDMSLTFTKDIVASFKELGGVPGPIGQTTITPETVEQKLTSTEWKGRGLAKHHYRVEWEVVK